jgi:ABC-type transport system involved in multi-copper enzyme maturation permease subunit
MNPSMDATREKRLWTRAWDAFVDADPVLAKELLVTARTPTFVGGMVMAPLVLGAFVLLVRLGMSRLDPVAGRQLFAVYFTGLSIILGAIGSTLGSTVVAHEREAGALDALKFSALSPRRIVLGKLAAVVLAEAAVVAGTLPLLVFVLTMRGVSLGETCVALSIALACGVMTASVGVAVSAHAVNARRSPLVSLLVSGVVGIGVVIWLAVASDLGRWSGPFAVARWYFEAPCDGEYVAVLFVIPAYALTTVLWLGYAAATSGLMDLSQDRSLPIKHWTVGTYGMGTVTFAVCSRVTGEHVRVSIAGWSMTAVAVLAAVLLFVFVGEPVRPTRRMQVHRRAPVARVLYPRCLAPSVFFTVAASGIVLLSVPAIAGASGNLELDALWAIASLATLGGFIGAFAARRGATTARRLGAAALICLTLFFVLLRDGSRGPTWVDGICPLWLDPRDGARAQGVLFGSLVAWGTAALVSLAMMLRAVRAPGESAFESFVSGSGRRS